MKRMRFGPTKAVGPVASTELLTISSYDNDEVGEGVCNSLTMSGPVCVMNRIRFTPANDGMPSNGEDDDDDDDDDCSHGCDLTPERVILRRGSLRSIP